MIVPGREASGQSTTWTDPRGQSETLGFVIVFTLMLAGALVVVGLGATAINDTEQQLSDERAQKALTQFDSKAGLVALEEADSQEVSFATDASEQFTVTDRGWMRVTVINRTDDSETTVMNVSLGSVRYDRGNTRIAYQGGGVWKATGRGGQMLSPPEFHYRNGTLTLPTISLTGDAALGDGATIRQDGVTRTFPDPSKGEEWINPLRRHQVNVTVDSEYYVGWGQYFEERTDGEAIYHDENDRVTLELVVEADHPPVEGGLVTGTAETLVINNNAQIDSYNSTEGAYGSSGPTRPAEDDSKVIAASDVSIENNAILHGNIEAAGEVTIQNKGEIQYGNVSYGDDFSIVKNGEWKTNSHHWENDNASVRAPDPVDRLIDDVLAAYDDDNDNDNAGDISGNTLGNCDPQCTLTAGQYYLDRLDLGSDENLELNTTGGAIEIAIGGELTVDNDQDIEVVGDGRTNFYVDGNTTLRNGASVSVPNDNATQAWLYMRPDSTTTLRNNVVFQGVVFGPGGLLPGTEIVLDQNTEVFGGVVGDVDFQANNVWIHFDESLGTVEPVEHETTAVQITFLHVTQNRITVEAG